MGRIREFETEKALASATAVFWQKGYEASSIGDLTAAMGIQRASLYCAFGSKAELYEEALASYQEQASQALAALLENAPSPLEAVKAALRMAIPKPSCGPKGCFCLNAAVEQALENPSVRAMLASHFERMKALLAKAVAAGQADGSLSLSVAPLEAAAYLLTCIHGLHVAARTEPPEALEAMAHLMLQSLLA